MRQSLYCIDELIYLNYSFKSELERKENTLQTVVKQRDEERTLKEDERKQKDEALTRLDKRSKFFHAYNIINILYIDLVCNKVPDVDYGPKESSYNFF